MSHGTHADHAEAIAAIRALEKELGRPTTILADLQGPKLRVGKFAEGDNAELKPGQRFMLRPRQGAGRRHARRPAAPGDFRARSKPVRGCCSTTASWCCA